MNTIKLKQGCESELGIKLHQNFLGKIYMEESPNNTEPSTSVDIIKIFYMFDIFLKHNALGVEL